MRINERQMLEPERCLVSNHAAKKEHGWGTKTFTLAVALTLVVVGLFAAGAIGRVLWDVVMAGWRFAALP